MSIPTGPYTIRNVRWDQLAGANEQGLIVGGGIHILWIIIKVGDFYTMENVGTRTSAYTEPDSQPGDPVLLGPHRQHFAINQIGSLPQYTISTTDTDLYWSLERENGPVSLSQTAVDQGTRWILEYVTP